LLCCIWKVPHTRMYDHFYLSIYIYIYIYISNNTCLSGTSYSKIITKSKSNYKTQFLVSLTRKQQNGRIRQLLHTKWWHDHEIRLKETNFIYVKMCMSSKVLVIMYSQRKNVYESVSKKNVHESIWRWRPTNFPKDKTKIF
jgi:hypothetical protein